MRKAKFLLAVLLVFVMFSATFAGCGTKNATTGRTVTDVLGHSIIVNIKKEVC